MSLYAFLYFFMVHIISFDCVEYSKYGRLCKPTLNALNISNTTLIGYRRYALACDNSLTFSIACAGRLFISLLHVLNKKGRR